ncbi:hypothetical protein C8A00DRAFT_15264 [Chaetomidium leptoderma]|uniref:Uncharacterized protein n=1 Tax=Chaetomidium leptoderma TaxID=669021 RepID=A0AAN6VLJ0_9PEZI|nr:hypothetical protein C8A00DRAFT_15264 [Chaetomidium leptoderma]
MASAPHEYPGVNLPLRHHKQAGKLGVDFYRFGSFEGANGAMSELLQVREVAMMLLMDRLTDKPNWHEKVFDDAIVAKWRAEAVAQPEEPIYQEILGAKNADSIPMPKRTRFMTEAAFDFCIAELKCKAAHFNKTGLVFTLNATNETRIGEIHNTAVKADTLVSTELQQGLKAAFEKLRAEQGSEPDWHPGSDDMVQDLVHPSMYPFVYGKTKFIQEEVVGVADAVDKWSGKGETVPKTDAEPPREGFAFGDDDTIPETYWSQTYQWLPANLAFQDDGTVRFTSYINGLHPKKHPEIYSLVEKLIDKAIPAWEHVLSSKAINGSYDTSRVGDAPDVGPTRSEDDEDEVWEAFNPDLMAAHEAKEGPIQYHDAKHYEDSDEEDEEITDEDREEKKARTDRLKWREICDPLLPEVADIRNITYEIEQTLSDRFRDTGLQVIVKMASIELTPEEPDFPAGGWHIEGQMNERIVATALYYLDSDNVTPSHLSFRMATSRDQENLQNSVGQDLYHVHERIFGTKLSWGGPDNNDSDTVQTYGSVATPEGRLLAFPNVFLQDETKPGHRRFIALWLVDPLQRIISTANVPPQQFDWWAEAVFGTASSQQAAKGDMPPELFQLLLEQGAGKAIINLPTAELLLNNQIGNRLPAEVMEMIRRERVVPEGLMTAEEAREHRLVLMGERSAFVGENEKEWCRNYSFCEH